MTPFSKRTNTPHPIAFRLPGVSRQQLDELLNWWGENQSQAIIRCIERVWLLEKNQVSIPVTCVNPCGDSAFSQEGKKMDLLTETKLASLLSNDRNIEVALYPAGIEIRVSARMQEIDTIDMKDGKLEIVCDHENIINSTTRMYGKVGKYEIDLKPGDEGVFDQAEVRMFASRVEEIKALYLKYLNSLPTYPD